MLADKRRESVMSDNLKIWSECTHIDQKHLKAAKVNGMPCTTVNGLEMVRLFTKAFGPIGKSWRYEIAEERFDEVKPITGFEPLMELNHTVRLRFWIKHDSDWVSFEQYGHTKARYLAGARSSSPYIAFDEEYAKKSTTDALKKCLSLLGVAADVYTGQVDDHAYMAEVADKQNIAKADESASERQKAMDDIADLMRDAIKCIENESEKMAASRTIRMHKNKLANRLSSATLGAAAQKALNNIEQKFNEKYGEK